MSHRKTAGSMYMYEASESIVIGTVSQYRGVSGFSAGSHLASITFAASSTGAITDTADNGSVLRCTDVAHGLSTGNYVNLVDMTDALHLGKTSVTVIDVDTFDCDDIAYNSINDTGNWYKGSSLTIDSGNGGLFRVSYGITATCGTNNKNFKFELVKNITDLDELATERKFGVLADLGDMGRSGHETFVGGDVLWLSVKGTTDDTNFTMEHSNVNLDRL